MGGAHEEGPPEPAGLLPRVSSGSGHVVRLGPEHGVQKEVVLEKLVTGVLLLLPLLGLLPSTVVFYSYLLLVACHVYFARAALTLLALLVEVLPTAAALILDSVLTTARKVDSSFPPDSVYYKVAKGGWHMGSGFVDDFGLGVGSVPKYYATRGESKRASPKGSD